MFWEYEKTIQRELFPAESEHLAEISQIESKINKIEVRCTKVSESVTGLSTEVNTIKDKVNKTQGTAEPIKHFDGF